MKEVGTTSWISPNKDATNTSLFSALPGGYRSSIGGYYNIGYSGNWWSSSESSAANAWSRNLYSNDGSAGRYFVDEKVGFSVRCLRD
jgi:uncharacterized protein (TIGR02145 family)